MYCQVIKPHKSDFDFFKNLKFPLFRHNKEMGPYSKKRPKNDYFRPKKRSKMSKSH